MNEKQYIWYVGYGSNLCEKRFLNYIKGGKFEWGGSDAKGCSDRTDPEDNKPIQIPYRLYFARSARNWGRGGVAFLRNYKEVDRNLWTWGRMWKITKEQYNHVRNQEGPRWYNEEIELGELKDIPIYTITYNAEQLIKRPAECYLRTIILGPKIMVLK